MQERIAFYILSLLFNSVLIQFSPPQLLQYLIYIDRNEYKTFRMKLTLKNEISFKD